MIANKADALAEIVRLQDSYERLRASHDRQMEVILAASNRNVEFEKWLNRMIEFWERGVIEFQQGGHMTAEDDHHSSLCWSRVFAYRATLEQFKEKPNGK